MKSTRKVYLDILRIVAIFWVIFNHTGEKGFFLFSVTPMSVNYGVYLLLSIFCKIAVPLFFMISGAVLLEREYTVKEQVSRALKYILIILGCSLFWYMIFVRNDYFHESFSIALFLKRVYSSNMLPGYWFLYSYVSVLIMLPFIRRLILNMNEREFIYMFILYILFTGLIPVFQYLLFDNTIRINISIPIVTFSPIFYLAMGYYVDHYLKTDKIKKYLRAGAAVGVICIGVSCCLTYFNAVQTGVCNEESSQLFHSTFIVIPVITTFCFIKYIVEKAQVPPRLEKFIISFSHCVFGIYLSEQYLREKLLPSYERIFSFLPPLTRCVFGILYVMIIGYILISALRKIPVVRKFI